MELKYSDLDASFYINSFIKQMMPRKRYEDWIIELVNQSDFFLEKSGGEKYIRPPHESHGECDCESSTYKVDFKLVGSKDFYQTKRALSPSFEIDEDNNLWINNGRDVKDKLHYNLHEICKKYSLKDIENINDQSEERLGNKEESILKGFINILNVEKHAIFVIPAIFTFDKREKNLKPFADEAALRVFGAFDSCIKYRDKHSDKESYWAFFYEKYFCVYEYHDSNNYRNILMIDACKSPMFKKINDLVNYSYRGKNNG